MEKHNYPIKVFYSEEDEGYIVTVPDLPGCSAFGKTEEMAVKESKDAISAWIQAQRASGRPVPKPSTPARYSGKFLLRMPVSLHQNLAEKAEVEGVSLNQFMEYLLAHGLGSAALTMKAESRKKMKHARVSKGASRGAAGHATTAAKKA